MENNKQIPYGVADIESVKKVVTILIPCYNEEKCIPLLYTRLSTIMSSHQQYDWELLFVNDGSNDNTLALIEELSQGDKRVAYIDLSRNFGKENAMLAGFDYASGDCMIIMDADLQDPPEIINDMLKMWEEGVDDVYAKRRTRGKESFIRGSLSRLFYYLLDKSTRYDVLKNVGDFRLLDRKCIDALKQLRENERYTKGLFCWIGFNKQEILFDRGDRAGGETKWNYRSLFNLAIEGITSFTTAPLRMATFIGIVVAIWALCYMVWIISKVLIWGDPVAGYPTIMTVMLFIGAVQLICIGILGEYVGRIFNETKNRPSYLIKGAKGITKKY
ncbi:MAG: glycosyltransferase family 2 protein [Prevotellaceae bacterium]|nr:glycosyltransferase family 2 protein [Prevotellaceae bacterium]